MSKFQLNPKAALSDFESSESSSSVYTRLYDANINPSVTNEFATAAFRMGHSLVQDIIELVSISPISRCVDVSRWLH